MRSMHITARFPNCLWQWGLLWCLHVTSIAAHAQTWSTEEQREFLAVRSEYSLTSADREWMFREILQLERDLQKLLRLPPGDGEIEISIFRTKNSYKQHLLARVPEGSQRQALFVPGVDRGRVYVYRHWGYEADLRHESTHALLHRVLPYVPMWLDEGLAEYFEVPAERRARQHPHLGELRRRLLFGWRPDLRKLESKTKLLEMDASDYRECWSWAHFMLHGPSDVRQELADFLDDVYHGRTAGTLGSRLLKLPETEARLVDHLRNWK
jgi:hypothetical protein